MDKDDGEGCTAGLNLEYSLLPILCASISLRMYCTLPQPIRPKLALQEVSLATAKAEFYFDNTMEIAESDLEKKNKRRRSSASKASKRKSITTHHVSADNELDCMHDRQ